VRCWAVKIYSHINHTSTAKALPIIVHAFTAKTSPIFEFAILQNCVQICVLYLQRFRIAYAKILRTKFRFCVQVVRNYVRLTTLPANHVFGAIGDNHADKNHAVPKSRGPKITWSKISQVQNLAGLKSRMRQKHAD
jgi:hypothetical protein